MVKYALNAPLWREIHDDHVAVLVADIGKRSVSIKIHPCVHRTRRFAAGEKRPADTQANEGRETTEAGLSNPLHSLWSRG
jgi:hypothetical protein